MAGQLLVMAAIEKAEGISADDAEYKQSLQDMIDQSGVTEDQFFTYYDRFSVEQSLMLQRINKIIVDSASVTETVATADDSTSEASETTESTTSTADETTETSAASTVSTTPETSAAAETSGTTENDGQSTEPSITKDVLQPLN